jgi:hypothetical protein
MGKEGGRRQENFILIIEQTISRIRSFPPLMS